MDCYGFGDGNALAEGFGVEMTEQAKSKRFSDSAVRIIAIWLGFAANCGGCVAIKIFDPRASEPTLLLITGTILLAIGWSARRWRAFVLVGLVPDLLLVVAPILRWLRS